MLDTLRALCALPGVSGHEDAVRTEIRRRAEGFADEIIEDKLGNLLVFKRGARPSAQKIMLCAHMDEVGVVVTHITDEGYLKFAAVGGIDRRVILGKRVFIGENALPGLIGLKAIHLVKREEREQIPKLEDLYIDIGAPSRVEAEKYVKLGDAGTFAPEFLRFGDDLVASKAIDDRFGCAVLLKLLESALPTDAWFAFTVQEEVGTRGAGVAALRLTPDIALVLEATTAADLPGVAAAKTVCKLGGGAVAPFMDGGAIYDRALWTLLKDTAAELEIPWQTKEYISGGTDASAVQRAGLGARTVALAAPVRNLHSPSCIAKISDLEAVTKLAAAFLEKISEYGNAL
jgi:endoglucanase